jgi:dephospho-CoA kinase
VHRFGSRIKQRDAEIDRKKLAQIVFNNESKRKLLERIVHEQVLRDVQSQLRDYSNSKEPLVFIDIPLLFEVKWEFLVDETWVIACDEKIQIKRLINRDNLSKEEAQSRLNAQIPIEDKKSLGDVLIDSNQSIKEMYSDVDKELKRLNELVSL